MHLHELLTYGSIDRDLVPEELHLLIRHYLDVQPTNSIAVAQLLYLHLHLQLLLSLVVLLLLVRPLHPPLFCTFLVLLRLHSQLTHLGISISPVTKAKRGKQKQKQKQKQKPLNWKQRRRDLDSSRSLKKRQKKAWKARSAYCAVAEHATSDPHSTANCGGRGGSSAYLGLSVSFLCFATTAMSLYHKPSTTSCYSACVPRTNTTGLNSVGVRNDFIIGGQRLVGLVPSN